MQSVAIYDVEPVTFYSFLYVFILHVFSNISKIVSESSHTWFCREFQVLSFDKKRNKIYQKMKREKLYNLHSKAHYNCFQKKSKFLCDQFFHGRNLITQNFAHFENKKCNYKISDFM